MPRDFVLTEEQVLGLPVDALALEILRDVDANGEWNSRNWLLLAEQGGVYGNAALLALGEAWQWLYNQGLVAVEPTNTAIGAMFVTRLGREVADAGPGRLRAIQQLTVTDLHPSLAEKVRPQFLLGEHENAAFVAMKAVEVRVRGMAGAPPSLLGVKLMRQAFGDGGPLADPGLDKGEQVARMELFAGAIGTIKNPTSHRDVDYDDPTEAVEVILLADLLMRILDRVE